MVRDGISDRILNRSFMVDCQDHLISGFDKNWLKNAKELLDSQDFINWWGLPLRRMPKLELDSALLDQPL